MNIALEHLLSQIPSDAQERVERTRELINRPIREALRQETGLRLDRNGQDEARVSIRLVPGLPTSLRKRTVEDKFKRAMLLAPLGPDLKRLKHGANRVGKFLDQLPIEAQVGELLTDAERYLPGAAEFAESLLREIETFDFLKWLFQERDDEQQIEEVADDILGLYRYNAFGRAGIANRGSIEVYWAVIGLVAALLDVRIEDLTTVVLTHELAHAYTHLGYDIDGANWPGECFAKTESVLKEGLAQYYTQAVCTRLRQMPGCVAAFEALLNEQPEPYRIHVPWVEEFSPEEVRHAMLETRRQSKGELQSFQTAIRITKGRLRPSQAKFDV